MKHFLLVGSILASAVSSLFAQCLPFSSPCNTSYYTVLGPQEQSNLTTGAYEMAKPSKLYRTTAATGALTQIGVKDLGVHVNALAYNPTDNFLYGMVDTSTFDRVNFSFEQRSVIYRIGEGGCTQRMGEIVAPLNNPSAYARGLVAFVGDMDKAGNYYFPAFVVNSLNLVTNTVDFDMYLGKIEGSDLTDPRGGYLPTYTKIDKNTCSALLDKYILAYCLAIIQGQPRPNTGLQDWAYNADDNTLWGYVATDKKFFRLPLPDPANPVPLTAFCDDAPASFPDLSTTEMGGFYFDGNQNLYGLDPERGKYYKVSNCQSMSCDGVALVREYTQDFEAVTYPTFKNLRGDMASCALRTPITPSNLPFDCAVAKLVVLSEQDSVKLDGSYQYAGKSQLYQVDEATGALTLITERPMPLHLDGLAISPITGFGYAMSDSLRIEASILIQEPMMQRIDNAGFTRPLFKIETPDLNPLERAIILTQAGEMDNDGNYYLTAVVLNATNSTAPYVANYTLYVGVIPAAEFTAGLGSVKPNYLKIDINSNCGSSFDRYIENLVASVIENTKRPLTGVQDWAYDKTTNSLYSFLSAEATLVTFALPAGNVGAVSATCQDITSLPNDADAALTGQFFGADGNLYTFDTQNAVYYEIKTCTNAGGCSATTPLISYADAFSPPTKLDFKALVGDAAACPNRGGSLPVELAEFIGVPNKCDIALRWVTNSEKNNARFEVQKSINGSDFVTIASLNGNGTSNLLRTYEYFDKTATKQNYYRLKQVDFDGTVNFPSAVISVRADCNVRGNIGIANIFPNPTAATATLSFNASAREVGKATWILSDVAGRIVAQQTQNLILDNNLIELDMQNLANGVYILRLQGESWYSEAAKVVKMKK